ncbi:U32 family peptidase [Desulfovibrio inopinatus]|uniref:U32 family peptidase n=1 Tax=Desulfovibrio inopinatus TaxID=102109 RepID=UPI0004207784|nr:peptidase U32 family protein [Desulfovibrio inopinatus]
MTSSARPELLAPAGDRASFLAALAAGADAVYVGLKHFSARMQADNFSITELAQLTELAHKKSRRVYVAINTLVKPDEIDKAGRLIDRTVRLVAPDAFIVCDLGVIELARQVGFSGEIHVSTLANISHQRNLSLLPALGVQRAVLPRELNVDEIRAMSEACPDGVTLETFVHGALCHNISGRCYWSSFLGGKSGLRGRCVQPCRRVYENKGQKGRYFSCLDLSLDVLAKTLLTIKNVSAWKIEGRKKGPHYVYHTVSAYKLLRDEPGNPDAKKQALSYLEQSLGRPGTHYSFLPQKPKNPVEAIKQTGSGMVVGRLSLSGPGKASFSPRIGLLPGDILRIGYEDEPGHQVIRSPKSFPKGGRFDVRYQGRHRPKSGTQVFLIDRREADLVSIVDSMQAELEAIPKPQNKESQFVATLPAPFKSPRKMRSLTYDVWRNPPLDRIRTDFGMWLAVGKGHSLPLTRSGQAWWWLPPIIWPNEENEYVALTDLLLRRGARKFVLNAPWQRSLFPKHLKKETQLWAGPFCNTSNALALKVLEQMGFCGAIVSPELSQEDLVSLPTKSPLPLGIVQHGRWPLGLSRTLAMDLKHHMPLKSPMNEVCFTAKHGQNIWIFPSWNLDLTGKSRELERAGYSVYIHLREPTPKNVPISERPGLFNWEVGLI